MTVKKSKITPFQKGLVLGAVGVGALALGVKAVSNNNAAKPIGINEVREQGVAEKTITGIVMREKVDPSGKERYVIAADGGVKYALIGLKQAYGTLEKPMEPRLDERVETKGKNIPKPRLDRTKVDPEDVNSFEDYVGKKVTMTGFVVPVENDKLQRLQRTSQVQVNNGRRPSPEASAKPLVSPKGNSWDYPRFVVKSITVL